MSSRSDLSSHDSRKISQIAEQFASALESGKPVSAEEVLQRESNIARDVLLLELLKREIEVGCRNDCAPSIDTLRERFSSDTAIVERAIEWAADTFPDKIAPPSRTMTFSPIDEGAGIAVDSEPDEFHLSFDIEQTTSQREAASRLPRKLGAYSLIEVVGGGTYGTVYRAIDEKLDRQVAIKIANLKVLRSDQAIELFLHEARVTAKLKHPRLVSIFEVVESVPNDPNAGPFIVMEFVEAENLRQYTFDRTLPVDEVVSIVSQIAEGVGFANRQAGIVHRDLKPANILVDGDGQVQVADFGLALREQNQYRNRGEAVGTYAYMSPELVRGDSHLVDLRSDLWSLGVILYELLARKRPFQGKTKEELFEEILRRDPKPLRQLREDVPPELEQVCLRCLEKQPKNRYASAEELIAALQDCVPNTTTAGKRMSMMAIVGGLVAVIAVSASAYFITNSLSDDRANDHKQLGADAERQGAPYEIDRWYDVLAMEPQPLWIDPSVNSTANTGAESQFVDSGDLIAFQFGNASQLNSFELQADIQFRNPTRQVAGFFWRLPVPVTTKYHEACLGIGFEFIEENRLRVFYTAIEIEAAGFDNPGKSIRDMDSLIHVLSQPGPVQIQLTVLGGVLNRLVINGKTIAFDPVPETHPILSRLNKDKRTAFAIGSFTYAGSVKYENVRIKFLSGDKYVDDARNDQ